ncbi:hypothetical protein DOE73_15755, partial [Paenibacillus dendritiformis]
MQQFLLFKPLFDEIPAKVRLLENPCFYRGVKMSIYLIKTWDSEFFLRRDELHYIKNEVGKYSYRLLNGLILRIQESASDPGG